MATKQAVLDYLKHDRTIMQGRNLYNQFPNKSLATQAYISRLPNSQSNIKKISYELCKLVGITERQMNALLSQPITAKVEVPVVTEKSPVEMENKLLAFTTEVSDDVLTELADYYKIECEIPEFSKGIKGLSERKNLAKELELVVEGTKAVDYDAVFESYKREHLVKQLEAAKEALVETKLSQLDIKTKESIKLRDQFPFLREADCPRVLHLLVADMITAHENFVEKQPLLHEHATQEQLQKLVAEVKASYIEKKEIFAELEYYNEHKQLLGEHPIFEQLEQEEEIKKLNSVDLAKKISNLTNNINRNKSKLEKAKNDADKAKYQALVDSQTNLKEFAENELENRS